MFPRTVGENVRARGMFPADMSDRSERAAEDARGICRSVMVVERNCKIFSGPPRTFLGGCILGFLL